MTTKVRKRLSDLGCDIPAKSRRGQKELRRSGEKRDCALVADHPSGQQQGVTGGATEV